MRQKEAKHGGMIMKILVYIFWLEASMAIYPSFDLS